MCPVNINQTPIKLFFKERLRHLSYKIHKYCHQETLMHNGNGGQSFEQYLLLRHTCTYLSILAGLLNKCVHPACAFFGNSIKCIAVIFFTEEWFPMKNINCLMFWQIPSFYGVNCWKRNAEKRFRFMAVISNFAFGTDTFCH